MDNLGVGKGTRRESMICVSLHLPSGAQEAVAASISTCCSPPAPPSDPRSCPGTAARVRRRCLLPNQVRLLQDVAGWSCAAQELHYSGQCLCRCSMRCLEVVRHRCGWETAVWRSGVLDQPPRPSHRSTGALLLSCDLQRAARSPAPSRRRLSPRRPGRSVLQSAAALYALQGRVADARFVADAPVALGRCSPGSRQRRTSRAQRESASAWRQQHTTPEPLVETSDLQRSCMCSLVARRHAAPWRGGAAFRR